MLKLAAFLPSVLLISGSHLCQAAGGVLIFAPHPDDEAICCSGIIQQALAQGKPVTVALLTSGDAFTDATVGLTKKPADKLTPEDYMRLGRFRDEQTLAAMKILGAKPEATVCMGYPNGGLTEIHAGTGSSPYRQKFTQKAETYCLVQPDYHMARHGTHAPYTQPALMADTVELIKSLRPEEIYTTAEQDGHPDHSAACHIVRDAIQAAHHQCALYVALIHAGSGHDWPWPSGVTPQSPLQAHEVKGVRFPAGLPWPPPKRVPVTAAQAQRKLEALRAHRLYFTDPNQDESHQANMESFVKSEEVFWIPAGLSVSR